MTDGGHVMQTVRELEQVSSVTVELSPVCDASPGYQVLKTNLWTLHMYMQQALEWVQLWAIHMVPSGSIDSLLPSM